MMDVFKKINGHFIVLWMITLPTFSTEVLAPVSNVETMPLVLEIALVLDSEETKAAQEDSSQELGPTPRYFYVWDGNFGPVTIKLMDGKTLDENKKSFGFSYKEHYSNPFGKQQKRIGIFSVNQLLKNKKGMRTRFLTKAQFINITHSNALMLLMRKVMHALKVQPYRAALSTLPVINQFLTQEKELATGLEALALSPEDIASIRILNNVSQETVFSRKKLLSSKNEIEWRRRHLNFSGKDKKIWEQQWKQFLEKSLETTAKETQKPQALLPSLYPKSNKFEKARGAYTRQINKKNIQPLSLNQLLKKIYFALKTLKMSPSNTEVRKIVFDEIFEYCREDADLTNTIVNLIPGNSYEEIPDNGTLNDAIRTLLQGEIKKPKNSHQRVIAISKALKHVKEYPANLGLREIAFRKIVFYCGNPDLTKKILELISKRPYETIPSKGFLLASIKTFCSA
jgi:hypothetical protein